MTPYTKLDQFGDIYFELISLVSIWVVKRIYKYLIGKMSVYTENYVRFQQLVYSDVYDIIYLRLPVMRRLFVITW